MRSIPIEISDADGVLIMESETGKKVAEILKNYQFVQEEAQQQAEPEQTAEDTTDTASEPTQPKEEPTTDEQAVVEVTPEQRVEEEKKEKAKTKEAKKAKYQAKDIQKELPSTYQELLTLLSSYNADMKANGAQPINIQSFINTNKAAQDLIEKAYKNKAEAAKKRASSKEIDKFKARLEKAKSLEEFDDIVNLEGGNFNMKEYESINVPKLRNQLMEKLGQTSVASTEISDENRQQMEDVQAAAEKQQAANAKKLSDILAEDNSDVTDEDIDNIFC